jgi:hypothetical protein
MAKKKLITLAKENDFEEGHLYLDYIIDSLYNGQRQQCKDLYNEMKARDQKEFIESLEELAPSKEKELRSLLLNY